MGLSGKGKIVGSEMPLANPCGFLLASIIIFSLGCKTSTYHLCSPLVWYV